jgi:hypothetical protein
VKGVTVLSDVVNNVVVLVEGRHYPGLVVQGDRLHSWLKLAQADEPEARELLISEIAASVAEYDRVCAREGLLMPGVTPPDVSGI